MLRFDGATSERNAPRVTEMAGWGFVLADGRSLCGEFIPLLVCLLLPPRFVVVMVQLVSAYCLLFAAVCKVEAFAPRSFAAPRRATAVYNIFGRNKSSDETQDDGLFSFLNRDKKEEEKKDEVPSPVVETKPVVAASPTPGPAAPPTPAEQAEILRSEAERIRLEAQRMDAELTLSKIKKIEEKIGKEDADDLQKDIDVLLNKYKQLQEGGNQKKSHEEDTDASGDADDSVSSISTSSDASVTTKTVSSNASMLWKDYIKPFDEKVFKEQSDRIESMPSMMLIALHQQYNLDIITDDEGKTTVNKTECIFRSDQMARGDFSYSNLPPPVFQQADISKTQRMVEKILEEAKDKKPWFGQPKFGANMGNLFAEGVDDKDFAVRSFLEEKHFASLIEAKDTKTLAQLFLEYDYYIATPMLSDDEAADEIILQAFGEEPILKSFIDELNTTALDRAVDGLYPKCTTKLGKPDEEKNTPTEAQISQLVADVLPKAGFQSSSKPEKILGGYILRGILKTNVAKTGDEFISKLDGVMEKSTLKDKMTVLYTPDFSAWADDQESVLLVEGGLSPILYVTAPEICRDPRPFQLSIVTAIGIATTWYLSLYPFLLNSGIASRVDEELALADANMVPDLSWLTDLSIPLFCTFVGIQLLHELGHLVAAGAYGIKTSSPTFVPSIITGITSSVTAIKSPPKNKAAMFDFAVAGPLAGILGSLAAIYVGTQFTAAMDPATLPALPLEILRQSTLGGGIIEGILGNGVLNIPEGALGSQAVATMNLPLHPVAVAGYISLVVNALAVLPIGSKCYVRTNDAAMRSPYSRLFSVS